MDYIIKVNEYKTPETPKRSSIISHIHRILFINELKHLDKGQDPIIEFDAEECALAAILKAISDYKTLTGAHTAAMIAFLQWTYVNLDSAEIMERYEKAHKGT